MSHPCRDVHKVGPAVSNMNRWWAGLLWSVVLFGIPAQASAHGILLESTPRSDETVALGVSRVDLRFNSRIEHPLSRILLTGPLGERVPLPARLSGTAGPDRLTATLPILPPGLYTVHWRVFTVDGHLSHGRFSFQIAQRR